MQLWKKIKILRSKFQIIQDHAHLQNFLDIPYTPKLEMLSSLF